MSPNVNRRTDAWGGSLDWYREQLLRLSAGLTPTRQGSALLAFARQLLRDLRWLVRYVLLPSRVSTGPALLK